MNCHDNLRQSIIYQSVLIHIYFCTVNPFPEDLAVLLFYKPSEAEHQGTFEDGRQKLQKLIFMITIESLVEQGANVKLEVTPTDLEMFAESIVQRTIMAQQEEHKAAMQREAEERIPHVLSMVRDAKEYFFSWWNRKVERINQIENDAEVDSREMKHPTHVARLALIIQVLRYASDESHLQFVDMASVKAAIRLNDYFEDSYIRLRSFVANDTCEEPPKVLLSLLPDTFDTKTAIAIGKELQGVSERTVMNYLKELCHSRLLRKAKAGHYEKVMYGSGKYSINENE